MIFQRPPSPFVFQFTRFTTALNLICYPETKLYVILLVTSLTRIKLLRNYRRDVFFFVFPLPRDAEPPLMIFLYD